MLRAAARLPLSTAQLLLLGLGLLSAVSLGLSGARTGATFAAETTNQGNSFSLGTLVMVNSVGTDGARCSSTGAGALTDTNVNGGCSSLFASLARKPGEPAYAVVAIRNAGSVAAETFQVFSTGCTPGDAPNEVYRGTGDPCSATLVSLQQCADAQCTVPVTCAYGGPAADGRSCGFGDPAKTLAAFAGAYSATAGLPLGRLPAGETAYVRVGLQLDPKLVTNAHQGRRASFDLSWRFAQ